jgi:hypothetical protein
MKKLLGFGASVACLVGIFALTTPAPAASARTCRQGTCTIEEGFCTGPCEYWQHCAPHCVCKAIPGCKV